VSGGGYEKDSNIADAGFSYRSLADPLDAVCLLFFLDPLEELEYRFYDLGSNLRERTPTSPISLSPSMMIALPG